MSINIKDLQPKSFTIEVRGQKAQCLPLRLSHALIVQKVGNVLESPQDFTNKEIKRAQADLDELIAELIPDFKGILFGINDTVTLIQEIMGGVEPQENKELAEAGVSFEDKDPKVTGVGK